MCEMDLPANGGCAKDVDDVSRFLAGYTDAFSDGS